MSESEREIEATPQAGEAEVIRSYDARVHWSRVLDRVGEAHRYLVSKGYRAFTDSSQVACGVTPGSRSSTIAVIS